MDATGISATKFMAGKIWHIQLHISHISILAIEWHIKCASHTCIVIICEPSFNLNCLKYAHSKKGVFYLNIPCWESGMLASYRSQSGEHFLPSSLSLSPCLKNSSHSLSVHSVWWSQGLPGWEMSAICTKKLNSLGRSDPSSWLDLYMTKYITSVTWLLY